MNMLRGVTNRKYLQRILFYFNLSMMGLLLFTSVSFYAYSKEIVLQTQREADRKVLSQIKHNLSYIEEIVQNVAIMVNLDPGIVYLMNAESPEPVMKFQTLRKLDTMAEATTFIDSIAVVGAGGRNMYFGGSGLWTRTHMAELQETLRDRLASIRPEDIGRLVPIRLQEETSGVDVFSFLLIGNHPNEGGVPNAVVVNVRPQWIFENVSNVNTMSAQNADMILVDRHGTILYSGEETARPHPDIASFVGESVRHGAAEEAEEFSVQRIGDRSYVVSQMSVGISEWRIMNLLPYDEVMSGVQRLRDLSILFTFVFLAAGFLLSLFVANRLYRPIRKLLDLFRSYDVRTPGKPPLEQRDEMSFLAEAYRDTLSRLEHVNEEEGKTKRIVEDYYLRCWIADSASQSEEEYRLCAETSPHLFEGGEAGVWRLAVLSMDSTSTPGPTDGFREKLYRFAVCNIVEETLSRAYAARVIDMNNEFIVAVLRAPEGAVDAEVVSNHVAQAHETFRQYYRRTFSTAVSEAIVRRTALTEAYETTMQQLLYRYAFGPGSVITPALVAGNRDRDDAAMPRAIERSLVDSLKAKDEEAVRDSLRRLFEWIGSLHYDYMTFAVQQVVLVVKQALREPAFAAHANAVELQRLNRRVLQAESLTAAREAIEACLAELCRTGADPQKEDRNALIVYAIKEIIEKNFSDITLSLQSIASLLKMSPAYVGRVFRQYEQVSVGDYLTGYRLEKARDLLTNSDYNVKEIADYLGFSNASYFITLFKKKYGATPKEYRVNASLGK